MLFLHGVLATGMQQSLISVYCLAAGLGEQADSACTAFEHEARAASSQLAHAADFADHADFHNTVQHAQHYQHLQGGFRRIA